MPYCLFCVTVCYEYFVTKKVRNTLIYGSSYFPGDPVKVIFPCVHKCPGGNVRQLQPMRYLFVSNDRLSLAESIFRFHNISKSEISSLFCSSTWRWVGICHSSNYSCIHSNIHLPMDAEDTVKKFLTEIFPQVGGDLIHNSVEEAKRRSVGLNSSDILPICIDLILGSGREIYLSGKQPSDDIIFVGSKKVDSNSERNKWPLLYVEDEKNECVGSSETSCEVRIHPEPEASVQELRVGNFMSQPNQTASSNYSSMLQSVTQVFPGVDCEYVKLLLIDGRDVNEIVNFLLENPHLQNRPTASKENLPPKDIPTKKHINYFKDYSSIVSFTYQQQCIALLKNDFRKLYVEDIRAAWNKYNHHYAPTRKCLEDSLVAIGHSCDSSGSDTNLSYLSPTIAVPIAPEKRSSIVTITRLLGRKRNIVPIPGSLDEELAREMEFVKKQRMLDEEKKDEIYALHLNEQQYEEEGQLIECGCCFGEFPFENIVQCSDGHLFCCKCLESYAKEVIFGSAIATAELHCMSVDCNRPFPYDQLRKVLTEEEIVKYQEHLQEDCLSKADLPNLIRCPFCKFAAIVAMHDKEFRCLNPKCLKVTCKDCQEEWKDHFGLKCSEVEKKSQTNLRLSYEERMTMAKVRKCGKCSCQFMKSEGCNKMTCRCGQTMCYVCRKSGIHYGHFCSHPRDPGKKCTQCSSCSLWSDPSEDDELAVKQLECEAKEAKRKLEEDLALLAKKQKV